MTKFSITLYYKASGCSYEFGPMDAEECVKFQVRLNELDPNQEKYSEPEFFVINDPATFGTGQEVAIVT
jgi:hypothetical protein